MLRRIACLCVLLASLLPADLRAQNEPEPRGVTLESLQVFGPLTENAPAGNAGMFVGVNRFTRDDGLPELAYAVHDAIELAHLFVQELKLLPAANCYLLLSGEPSAESVKLHLAQLRAAGAKISGADRSQILLTFLDLRKFATSSTNLFVCSFSSHGFNEGRTAYVMPSDGHRELLGDTAVPLETIETRMEDSKAGHRLLLVDACQERRSARGSSAAGKAADVAFIDALKRPSGQAKLASCSPGEFSFEHGSLGGVGHGVFTHSFLEALRGGAKSDDENLVRLGSVADYVAASVAAWTKQAGSTAQTPFLESPVDAKKLPLATKADDLTTLIATVQRQPLAGELTEELRGRIVAALRKINPAQAADRQFLTSTRDFVQGRFNAALYIPYARTELDRLVPAPPALLVAPFSESVARSAQTAWAKHLRSEVETTNSIGMTLKLIPPGDFLMGSSDADVAAIMRADAAFKDEDAKDEQPQHRVRITQPFYMGVYEVTQSEWQTVMNSNPSYFQGGQSEIKELDTQRFPVEYVSWFDCLEFCNKLSQRDGRTPYYRLSSIERADGSIQSARVDFLDGTGYRLPTEIEWEYACRAGTMSAFYFGDTLNGRQANVNGNMPYGTSTKSRYLERTTRVGSYPENAFGLFDMHGNVFEWCQDAYNGNSYERPDPVLLDPTSERETSYRILRGGSWYGKISSCRSAYRAGLSPDHRCAADALRVACRIDIRTSKSSND